MDNKPSRMYLWECTYKVDNRFYIKDWIWSTTKPESGIGNYWIRLFNYQITEKNCYLVPDNTPCDKFIMQDNPF